MSLTMHNNTSNNYTTINQFDPSQLLQTTTTLSNLISQSNSTLDAKLGRTHGRWQIASAQ